MALIGYLRVSTDDQTLDLQRDALQAVGCLDMYEEHASGARATRPELAAALRACRQGDTLVVWKLDRLGRSMKHLVEIVEDLHQRGIGFQVLTGVQIDTTTPQGMFAFQLFAALAEYERALIRERVMAGLAAARARGRKGGRRPKLSQDQQQLAVDMAHGRIPITTIAQTLGCSRHTVYKALAQAAEVTRFPG
jgi:DNA invertase Pin-like site-specific DNA recombinase